MRATNVMVDGERAPICGYGDAFAIRGTGARYFITEIGIFAYLLEDGPIDELPDFASPGFFTYELSIGILAS